MNDKNVHSGHRERLRNRFLSTGMLGFSEHEMLELILFYVIPRSDTNELAHSLIQRFGNISNILQADISELAEVKGMGESAAAFIKLIDSITDTVGKFTLEQIITDSTDFISSDLIRQGKNVTEDSFTIYYINSRSSVTDTCIYPINDVLSGRLKPRKLIEDAVALDAPSVIIGICHKNHVPVPTNNDYCLVRQLSDVLTNIEVSIKDVLIAGTDSCFSLRSDGAFSL